MVITDNLLAIISGEILGENPAVGANEDDWDYFDVATFDDSWGGVDGSGEKGSCYNGEDLHVFWSWGEMRNFFERRFFFFGLLYMEKVE